MLNLILHEGGNTFLARLGRQGRVIFEISTYLIAPALKERSVKAYGSEKDQRWGERTWYRSISLDFSVREWTGVRTSDASSSTVDGGIGSWQSTNNKKQSTGRKDVTDMWYSWKITKSLPLAFKRISNLFQIS